MEKDYVKIYEDTYLKTEVSTEKEIIQKYIDLKIKRKNATFAGNAIGTYFYEEQSNSRVKSKTYQTLYYFFKNRLNEYAIEYQMDVILGTLLPEFIKINLDDDYTFENYIKELAIFNARDHISNTFSNNLALYFLMFELNDFSEFRIKGCRGDHYSPMYEKYRKLVYDKPIKEELINIKATKSQETKVLNFFKIKEEYYEKFLSEEFYRYLCSEFIDEIKTPHKGFKDIFTKIPENHNAQLHFFAQTNLVSLLFFAFQKEIFSESQNSIFLKRRIENVEVPINKISTGQRSALALSIFLALNKKLKNGPNLILFDDPVTYTDDLNILSFLDYLREIVINENRQVVFATASQKLAGLFEKKFAFLGESEYKSFEFER
jgi:hypothetical protein